ncbi:MAG: hypothetical protein NTX45_19770 [Proteobacteria bacterium]|nr:hypothetical protein [Pseudomonadota bacterium]
MHSRFAPAKNSAGYVNCLVNFRSASTVWMRLKLPTKTVGAIGDAFGQGIDDAIKAFPQKVNDALTGYGHSVVKYSRGTEYDLSLKDAHPRG